MLAASFTLNASQNYINLFFSPDLTKNTGWVLLPFWKKKKKNM